MSKRKITIWLPGGSSFSYEHCTSFQTYGNGSNIISFVTSDGRRMETSCVWIAEEEKQ